MKKSYNEFYESKFGKILPENKCIRACFDLLVFYCSVKNYDKSKINMRSNIKQLSEAINNILPIDREFIVECYNEYLPIIIYGKCVNKIECEYYLIYNNKKYFITKGVNINSMQLAETFDNARIPF
jgi:hypothetical protein